MRNFDLEEVQMGRIRIVNLTENEKRPADYVLHGKKVFEGDALGNILDTNRSKISIVKMEKPEMCPICLTPGKVVNHNGPEGHFRCAVCQHKWG